MLKHVSFEIKGGERIGIGEHKHVPASSQKLTAVQLGGQGQGR